jgi:hypothetical protein
VYAHLQVEVCTATAVELTADLTVTNYVLEDSETELIQFRDDVAVSERTHKEVRQSSTSYTFVYSLPLDCKCAYLDLCTHTVQQ